MQAVNAMVTEFVDEIMGGNKQMKAHREGGGNRRVIGQNSGEIGALFSTFSDANASPIASCGFDPLLPITFFNPFNQRLRKRRRGNQCLADARI
jgi:hypothetical protein